MSSRMLTDYKSFPVAGTFDIKLQIPIFKSAVN